MTVIYCEQELDQIWSNLGRDLLDKDFGTKDNNLSNDSNRFMHNNTSTPERLDRITHANNILP
jgi:hypothetical protein